MREGEGEGEGKSEHGVRITAICLRRRPDRWAACEEHLLSVVPERLLARFDMFAGTDASAAAWVALTQLLHIPSGMSHSK